MAGSVGIVLAIQRLLEIFDSTFWNVGRISQRILPQALLAQPFEEKLEDVGMEEMPDRTSNPPILLYGD